jgi:methylthioribose-1-phosphate isomerase
MRTVEWVADGPAIRLIDQRELPGRLVWIELCSVPEVVQAIRDMAVRGAPAIGATAAFGVALAAWRSPAKDPRSIGRDLDSALQALRAARPTASNLAWALDRMARQVDARPGADGQAQREHLLAEAQRIADEDVEINRRMGGFGAGLLRDGDTVIHHCNTGALATVDFGTALGVIRSAHEQGKRLHVVVDETRPRLQGARLTAWELDQLGISHEIIVDAAAGHVLRQGGVAACFVGGDRVAANGDVANKIGTYMLALAAFDNQVPFYVVVPTSTIDLTVPDGGQIPIEDRSPDEVLALEQDGKPIAPRGSRARNPAFDVTPHRLISAIVTEVGVLRPPYASSLAEAVRAATGREDAAARG